MGQKILIIGYAFPPVFSPGAVRIERFAHYLSGLGHTVTVLTCDNVYSSMVGEAGVDDSTRPYTVVRTRDALDKTGLSGSGASGDAKAKAVPSVKSRIKGMVKSIGAKVIFPDRDVTWLPSAQRYIKRNKPDIDVVIATYPYGTNLLIGRYAAKICGAKFIADMRDLWTEQVASEKGAIFKRALERYILKKADMILNVSEYNSEIMRAAWPNTPVETIYNGYEPSLLPARSVNDKHDKFVMTYAGRFYDGRRNPLQLLDALATLKADGVITAQDFAFDIIGHAESFMQDAVTTRGLDDIVHFQGLKKPAEVYDILERSNMLLAITATLAISKGEMTTKVFEYIGVSREILCLTKPGYEIADVLDTINGAHWADVDNTDAIAAVLTRAYQDWKMRGQKNIHYSNSDRFSRERQTEKLSCAIASL